MVTVASDYRLPTTYYRLSPIAYRLSPMLFFHELDDLLLRPVSVVLG